MGKVYSSAVETLVWLGEASEDSDRALEFVYTLRQAVELFEDKEEVTEETLCSKLQSAYDAEEWSILGKLLLRDGFQRLWVIQEVALSPLVRVVCGNRRLDWECFTVIMGTSRLFDVLRSLIMVRPAINLFTMVSLRHQFTRSDSHVVP